jgi:hypothetical protein
MQQWHERWPFCMEVHTNHRMEARVHVGARTELSPSIARARCKTGHALNVGLPT